MGLQIDGIAASSAIDTSSESIDIENLDISSLQQGHGVFLVEHRKPKDSGDFRDVIGAVTFAKKIFDVEDCDDDRQRAYWDQLELPFVYIRGELFDDDGHEGAKAAAAIIRYYQRNDMPIVLRYSIDGQTIEREGNVLKHCIARDVAITLKPCNQSCVSGVIESTSKAKPESPFDELSRSEEGLRRLTGVSFNMLPPIGDGVQKGEAELLELNKAMTAGFGGAAPGALSQGPALAKEDVTFRNRVKAAFRDWDRRKPLLDHMEKSLPDANPDFLKKFVDLVAENRLKKASELHEHLEKAVGAEGTAVKAPNADDLRADASPESPSAPKSVPGFRTKPQPLSDEQFQAMASATNAQAAAAHPEMADLIARGAANAARADAASKLKPHVPGLRVGLASGGVRQHAAAPDPDPHATRVLTPADRHQAIFDEIKRNIRARSPQVAAEQEFLTGQPFGRSEDVAKAEALTVGGRPVPVTRAGLTEPIFDVQTGILHTRSGSFPVYIPGHDSVANRDGFHQIMDSAAVNGFHEGVVDNWAQLHAAAKQGRLPPAVIAHAAAYHAMQPGSSVEDFMREHMAAHQGLYAHDLQDIEANLIDLVSRHKGDARAAAREMVSRSGEQSPAFNNASARHIMAMLGGGNVALADPDFMRYVFGLDADRDADAVHHIRGIFEAPGHQTALALQEGLENYLLRHHDGVQHMLGHAQHGRHFDTDPEAALLPSMLKIWAAAPHHERLRGLRSGAETATSAAVHTFLKSEDQRWAPAARTAALHHEWRQRYGSVPAFMLYLRHLVPHLMLGSGLRKAEAVPAEPLMPPAAPRQEILTSARHGKIKPGILAFRSAAGGQRFRIVGDDDTHYHVIPGRGTDYRVTRVPKSAEHKLFDVAKNWQPVRDAELRIGDEHLSYHSRSPEQRVLASKIDVRAPREGIDSGAHAQYLNAKPWKQSSAATTIFVKPQPDGVRGTALAETSFHNVVRDFFGMPELVPTTVTFHHPESGKIHSAQEFVRGGRHVGARHAVLNKWHDEGITGKMSVMDYVLGNHDRHQGNFMATADERPKLIDNGAAFSYDHEKHYPHPVPDYVAAGRQNEELPAATKTWALTLDPGRLGERLLQEGLLPQQASMATARLQAIHDAVAKGKRLTYANLGQLTFTRPS